MLEQPNSERYRAIARTLEAARLRVQLVREGLKTFAPGRGLVIRVHRSPRGKVPTRSDGSNEPIPYHIPATRSHRLTFWFHRVRNCALQHPHEGARHG